MIRVAVTGATGFIGQALCESISSMLNVHLTVIGRRNPNSYLTFINIETESPSSVIQKLKNFDCIIHLAACAHSYNATIRDYERDNLNLTKKLASIAIEAKITQFIYLSSIKVLGNTTAANKPFSINDTPNPQDDYGKSKWESEKSLTNSLQDSPTAYTIIRPPLVWGRHVKGNLKTLINLINRGYPLPFGAINNRRDLVSIANLTDFIKCTLLNPKAFNETFLVSDGRSLKTKEIICLLEEFTEKKAKIIYCPTSVFNILRHIPKLRAKIESFSANLEIDISETLKKLDWKPLK